MPRHHAAVNIMSVCRLRVLVQNDACRKFAINLDLKTSHDFERIDYVGEMSAVPKIIERGLQLGEQ